MKVFFSTESNNGEEDLRFVGYLEKFRVVKKDYDLMDLFFSTIRPITNSIQRHEINLKIDAHDCYVIDSFIELLPKLIREDGFVFFTRTQTNGMLIIFNGECLNIPSTPYNHLPIAVGDNFVSFYCLQNYKTDIFQKF